MERRQILLAGGAVALAGTGMTYAGLRQMGSMQDYDSSVAAMRAQLPERPETADLIR